MEEHIIIGLVSIIILGVSAQWLAMRVRMPSILFLLIFGFIGGPITGVINPDALFGDLLFPIISLSVAVILFEGGMDLRLHELKGIGHIVRNLITIGVLVTWVLVSAASYFVLNLNLSLSILLGAILVVTGPTVIGPLLRHVRPSGRAGNIVKWEGIMNDPIGVVLAVLVFESILHGNLGHAGPFVIFGILKTIVIGCSIGGVGAWLLLFLLKKYAIPDALHQVVTLMFVFGTFVLSNHYQAESGLLTVTLMGIILANQKSISVHHILEFKENLRVLIISVLFIILAARLDLSDFQNIGWRNLLFLGVLFVVVRPLSTVASCWGNKVDWKEKIFISCMAPRGIVAAAMASVFAYELTKSGHPQAERLVPLVFIVIITTVAVYGLMAMPIARWLGMAVKNPQGVLIVGAHSWARQIAKELKDLGYKIIVADTNKSNVRQAKKEGLETYYGTVFSENIEDEIDLSGIGKLLAFTSNDEANSLATIRFKSILGKANVYQLFPEEAEEGETEDYSSIHLQGRYLFQDDADFETLNSRFIAGSNVKLIKIAKDSEYEKLQQQKSCIPLFLLNENNELVVISPDEPIQPKAGEQVLAVISSS